MSWTATLFSPHCENGPCPDNATPAARPRRACVLSVARRVSVRRLDRGHDGRSDGGAAHHHQLPDPPDRPGHRRRRSVLIADQHAENSDSAYVLIVGGRYLIATPDEKANGRSPTANASPSEPTRQTFPAKLQNESMTATLAAGPNGRRRPVLQVLHGVPPAANDAGPNVRLDVNRRDQAWPFSAAASRNTTCRWSSTPPSAAAGQSASPRL